MYRQSRKPETGRHGKKPPSFHSAVVTIIHCTRALSLTSKGSSATHLPPCAGALPALNRCQRELPVLTNGAWMGSFRV